MAEIISKIGILDYLTIALNTFVGTIGTENINIATDIFMPLTTIMIILFGIAVALGKSQVSDMFYKCLIIGVYFYFIQNYDLITSALLDFSANAGLKVGGSDLEVDFLYDPSAIIIKGLSVSLDILIPENFMDFFKLTDNFFRSSTSICVLLCFIFIALSDFLFVVEYHLVTTLLVIVFPFGILNIFSFVSESVISGLYRLNVKLMTFAFVVSLSLNLLEEEIVENLSHNPSLEECLVCVACLSAICISIWKVPNMAAAIITGNPSISGQGIAGFIFSLATRPVSKSSSVATSETKK